MVTIIIFPNFDKAYKKSSIKQKWKNVIGTMHT